MRFFISFILIGLLSFASCTYFPWWSIAIVGFIVCLLIPQKPGYAFLAGFISIFLLWICLSFYLSLRNEHILAHKISLLFLKSDNPLLLIIVTGLIGGIIAGLGSITGSLFRSIAKPS